MMQPLRELTDAELAPWPLLLQLRHQECRQERRRAKATPNWDALLSAIRRTIADAVPGVDARTITDDMPQAEWFEPDSDRFGMVSYCGDCALELEYERRSDGWHCTRLDVFPAEGPDDDAADEPAIATATPAC